jgi:predicted nucleic acid-binding Zn finger protein
MINIYSITAAIKILGRKDILKLEVWARVIFVKFANGQGRFVSKNLFWIEFHRSRKERAKDLTVEYYDRDLYQVSSQSQIDPYFVSLGDDIQCECADFANQVKAKFRYPICKHAWALLNHLNFNSLSAYIQSNQEIRAA